MTPDNRTCAEWWPPLQQLKGPMAERVLRHRWEETALGPPQQWPRSLRHAVTTLLECRLPMYLAWGPAFTQIYNDAYRPILGDKDAAALGSSAQDTWHEIWPTIGPMWESVLGGEAIGFDDFKLTIDRFGYPEDCYFNFSYSPVRDDEGMPRGVLVTFAETTTRVLNEQRLRFLDEMSQATRQLTEPAEVMSRTAAMLGQHLGVNRCAYAHVLDDENTFDLIGDYNDGVASIVGRYKFSDFGAAVEQLMRDDKAYVNPDVEASPLTAGLDLSAYRQTSIRAVICVPLHKEGRLVAAMAVHQASPRRWTPAEVELVQTVVDRCWDALERLRVQAALHEQARSLEVLNRTGAALSAELDLQTLLQRVTDAATELSGARFGAFFYSGRDEQGDAYMLYTLSGAERAAFEGFGHPRATPLFGPTFRGSAPVRLDDVLADPRFGQWAPHHGMPQGHLPVRSYLAVPVVARTGEVLGGLFFGHPEVGVFTERSERLVVGIAGQAAIAVDNARLYASSQQAAQERAHLLESERAARVAAERASTIKDEFLATLSHELRTPLSAIAGWSHILKRKVDPSNVELLKGIEVILRNTQVQTQLIDDLLDMSRITSGKLALDRQPISPVTFVQAALDVIRPSADAAGVSMIEEVESVGTLLGDAGRLQQVVWNLVANAVKFTPRGGTVRVRLVADGPDALIEVRDTGVGIRPEYLPYVFDRFRQADSSITRQFGGLGLGLSIVRNLVELHGGTVRAYSEGEGRGATFSVRLPLLHSGAGQGDSLLRSAATPSVHEVDLSGRRVLVVDDDDDLRDFLQRVLQDSGADVATENSAQNALARMERESFDVLVSDISMPGMDGYELMRQVRRTAREAELRAVALTAFARPEDRARALDAGFADHFTKPIEPTSFLAALAELTAPR